MTGKEGSESNAGKFGRKTVSTERTQSKRRRKRWEKKNSMTECEMVLGLERLHLACNKKEEKKMIENFLQLFFFLLFYLFAREVGIRMEEKHLEIIY